MLAELDQQVDQKSNDYDDLRNQWLAGQISVLASQLKPGTPCRLVALNIQHHMLPRNKTSG